MAPRNHKLDLNNNAVSSEAKLYKIINSDLTTDDKKERTSWWLDVVLEGHKCEVCNFWTTSVHLLADHYTTQHFDQKVLRDEKRKKRKTKVVPRLAENTDLINLKLAYKNDYWASSKNDLELKFKCLRCLESFETREERHRHVEDSKSPDNIFVCQICQERKASKEDLCHHIGFRHDPKQLRCQLCRKLTEYCVTNHQDYIYNIKDKNYDCAVCPKEFCKLSGLKRHLRS